MKICSREPTPPVPSNASLELAVLKKNLPGRFSKEPTMTPSPRGPGPPQKLLI